MYTHVCHVTHTKVHANINESMCLYGSPWHIHIQRENRLGRVREIEIEKATKHENTCSHLCSNHFGLGHRCHHCGWGPPCGCPHGPHVPHRPLGLLVVSPSPWLSPPPSKAHAVPQNLHARMCHRVEIGWVPHHSSPQTQQDHEWHPCTVSYTHLEPTRPY